MTHIIPDSTSCGDLGIENFLCSCRAFEPIDEIVENENDLNELLNLVDLVIEDTLYFLNMELRKNYRLLPICNELVLDKIIKV